MDVYCAIESVSGLATEATFFNRRKHRPTRPYAKPLAALAQKKEP